MGVRHAKKLAALAVGLGIFSGFGFEASVGALLRKEVDTQTALGSVSTGVEQPITEIPLAGPLANRASEVSGLTWYEDWLIILPQYPSRLNDQLFALKKSEILAFLAGETTTPLTPRPIAFSSPEFTREISGFEGFEAIAFRGTQAFLTIEAEPREGAQGYVVTGRLAEDLSALVVAASPIAQSPAQSNSPNKADEAIVLTDESVLSLYEVYGRRVNAMPQAHRFDFDLGIQGEAAFPHLEYRVTDATALDERDRFWVINYFYPGDRDLLPERDELAVRYGRGPTHRQQPMVERLVELAVRSSHSGSRITLTNTPPIQLELAEAGRNWEGLVRLRDSNLETEGFLLMTDKFPETILAFVALPAQAVSETSKTN